MTAKVSRVRWIQVLHGKHVRGKEAHRTVFQTRYYGTEHESVQHEKTLHHMNCALNHICLVDLYCHYYILYSLRQALNLLNQVFHHIILAQQCPLAPRMFETSDFENCVLLLLAGFTNISPAAAQMSCLLSTLALRALCNWDFVQVPVQFQWPCHQVPV